MGRKRIDHALQEHSFLESSINSPEATDAIPLGKISLGDDIDSSEFATLIPLHHRLYLVLRGRLVDGTYKPGVPLPGEHQLAAEFSLSRVTLRRTLKRLQSEGLIRRLPGAGTFPTADAEREPVESVYRSYTDYLSRKSQVHDNALLAFEYMQTPSFLDQHQGGFGRRVLKVTRLSSYQGGVVHFLRSYVPGDLGSLIDPEKLGSTPLLTVLESAGVAAERSELTLSATSADGEIARHLEVPVGSPLIYRVRVSWDEKGKPVEFHEALSRPDLYGVRLVLNRGEDGMKVDWPHGNL